MRGLFVGIGGTGDEILAQLKDKVYATAGVIPDSLQFRLIDTEAEDYRKNKGVRLGGEGSETTINSSEYLQLQDDPPGTFLDMTRKVAEHHDNIPEIARWYRGEMFLKNLPQADFNLVRGAGQHRQFARMGVFLNRQRMVNLLRKALSFCQGGNAEVPIWIIGSVAGGTGAGLFMDLALLARWVAKDMNLRFRIIGAAVLPDVFAETGIDFARSYAMLRELERFQAPVEPRYAGRLNREESFRFSVTYDSTMTVRLQGPLFDNLVFYNRKCESEEARRSYFSEVADGLNLLLDESAGDQLFREWINVQEGYAASFNSYRIFLPARLYRRQFVLQAALQLVEGLLPRDHDTQALLFGSEDDRRENARRIVGQELSPLFGDLLKPQIQNDFDVLIKDLTAEHIVRVLLGFGNEVGRFGRDIGEDRRRAAQRLYSNVFTGIETARESGLDFEDSKTTLQAEIIRRRRQYDGDGADSFRASLDSVRALVQEQIGQVVDDSARQYLSENRAEEQALGRGNRVLRDIQELLDQIRINLNRVVHDDRIVLEERKNREAESLRAMEDLSKSWIGWRGKLADVQDAYLSAAFAVVQWEQRQKLTAFLREMIDAAAQRFARWSEGIQAWQEVLTGLVNLCRNENNEIHQRLDRQTYIDSAALGLKNTMDMDGYQQYLGERCALDPNTNEAYIPRLLRGLRWQAGRQPQDLVLEGWPDQAGGLEAHDFSKTLNTYLEKNIGTRMDEFEGMANYLEWLRDAKKNKVSDLADDKLARVTRGFVDTRLTSPSRKFLFLHGDLWSAEKRSQDEFTTVQNALSLDPNFTGRLQHNLLTSDGVSLFKDKNVLAVLMVDNKIPYDEIPVIKQMAQAYMRVRGETNPAWRAHTYHSFRCDQEAWKIEQAQVLDTNDNAFPAIPGQYTRLLDEPERVELFAKALAVGVIRQQDVALGGKVWVCGEAENDERRLIYLNDPDDPNDSRDLHRALITFVLDQRDRRPSRRGTLELPQIRTWIGEALAKSQQAIEPTITAFVKTYSELFDSDPMDLEGVDEKARTQAFLALVLHYYLGKQ